MRSVLLVVTLLMTGAAFAQGEGIPQRIYFGAGFGYNKVPEFDDSKTEIQAFGGYRLGGDFGLDPSLFTLAVEAGYMDTSDVDHDGFWVTPVLSANVAPLTELFVRVGAVTGHDDGPVYGIGAGYHIERNTAVRIEYVEHPDAYSVQLNVVVYPWAWPY